MKQYKREYYLQKIRPFINKQLIKVITGQRRVGKSYLLQQIRKEIADKYVNSTIIYINLESLEFDDLKNFRKLSDYIHAKSKSGKNYVFIDEIQEVEGFEKVLRSLLTEDKFDIYCTGSNAKMLTGKMATYLSGRQIEFRVHALSFTEFLEFHKKGAVKKSLMEYLHYGGMPYLINLPEKPEIWNEYLKNIYNTILFRDIITQHEIRDVTFLENLVRYIADNIGSLVSASNIGKYLKSQNVNKTTQLIINYLHYIENSYCINRSRRYDIHGKKIFESGEKFYFEDLGIRNTIVGYNISDLNKIIENAVYNHLKYYNYNVFIGKINNMEIDFVAEKNGEYIYIQATYLLNDESTITREFGNLLKIKDNYPKYVVSFDDFKAPNTYMGITHFTLLDFLLEFKG
jgi:predicted AAA+ superfamily ATPase